MYQKILLAIDGSEHSMRAADEAIKMASVSTECQVVITFVVDYEKAKTEVLHSQGKMDLELARKSKLVPVEEKMKSVNIPYDVKILHGDPGPALVDYANKDNFDLVIIGSRGLNVLQEMVLGSVSHKVVKRANCPVLIVK